MHPSLVENNASQPTDALANSANRKTMPTSRAELAVRSSDGEGLPILLVHGVGGSSDDFDALFGYAFAMDHRLIAVDLPGHGQSGEASDPETAYTVEGYAETLLETLERLGIDNVFIIDRSEGGNIGRELLAIFPGALGLAVVGVPPIVGMAEANPEEPLTYWITSTNEEALEPVIQDLELREAALSVAPRLWYGG